MYMVGKIMWGMFFFEREVLLIYDIKEKWEKLILVFFKDEGRKKDLVLKIGF